MARSMQDGRDTSEGSAARFRALALPHLDAVYTLARYLLGNAADAEDATKQAFLRALRHFDSFRGPAIKPWLFAILRNVCREARRPARETPVATDLDAEPKDAPLWREDGETPESEVLRRRDAEAIRRLLDALPEAFREVLVLREIDDLSYREIADIVGAPIGTVMSRIARGRAMLRDAWIAADGGERKI
jgi:RNA polymerase sigma-70 factor (ECF subfamily)